MQIHCNGLKYFCFMNENSAMPFGKYKGQKLKDVPAGYLLWLYDNFKCSKDLRAYIQESLPFLKVQFMRRPHAQRSMEQFLGR